MEVLTPFLKVFVTGGLICAAGQILIDKTKINTARVLVIFVSVGVILTLTGLYQKLVDFGSAGATIPLTGFGFSLAKGVIRDVQAFGLMGAFTGGLKAAAVGVSSAIFFGYLASVAFKPQAKR